MALDLYPRRQWVCRMASRSCSCKRFTVVRVHHRCARVGVDSIRGRRRLFMGVPVCDLALITGGDPLMWYLVCFVAAQHKPLSGEWLSLCVSVWGCPFSILSVCVHVLCCFSNPFIMMSWCVSLWCCPCIVKSRCSFIHEHPPPPFHQYSAIIHQVSPPFFVCLCFTHQQKNKS